MARIVLGTRARLRPARGGPQPPPDLAPQVPPDHAGSGRGLLSAPQPGAACFSADAKLARAAGSPPRRGVAADQGAVRITGPSAVTATVCSACAAWLPSAVRIVQPSSSR